MIYQVPTAPRLQRLVLTFTAVVAAVKVVPRPLDGEGGGPLRYLNPVRCMKQYGASTAHRVCEDCWFGKFAPGTDHRCPGCAAEMPRPTALPAARVEYHDEVL